MNQKIESRSQLLYALTESAELEHTLMCQYLFAAASLKTSVKELENKKRCFYQFELIRKWKKALLLVAREEMRHLTYVINLLISIGGTPYFRRPNFPNYNRFYKNPDGTSEVTMSLDRFTQDAVSRFIKFEAPPPPPIPVADKIAFDMPKPNFYDNLHAFYNEIKDGFTDDMFIDYEDQYDPKDGKRSATIPYRKSISNVVKTAEEARKLIDLIREQGEGSPGEDPLAHVKVFQEMLQELQTEQKIDPDFDPARKVLSNTMTRKPDDFQECLKNKIIIIGEDFQGGLPYKLLQLFNSAYEIMLIWLYQAFDRHGAEKELVAIESLVFMPFMSEILRPLMEWLTRFPVSVDQVEGCLGASFEVSSNNFLIPKKQVSYKLSMERLKDMKTSAQTILELLKQSSDSRILEIIPDFAFLSTSISLLTDEFEFRVTAPEWPPKTIFNNDKAERVELIKPVQITPANISMKEWMQRGPSVLELKFEGWFQVWLGSDPDGANEKRGATGNNFAIADEPDFNRVVYFQPDHAIKRTHCPEIGVRVTAANIVTAPIDLNNIAFEVPDFVGAKVDLLNEPKFEGRNFVVSGVGEPLDPFEIYIETINGIKLQRAVLDSGKLNDMTSAQRYGTGRFTAKGQVSAEQMKVFLSKIGYPSPQAYLNKRIADLEQDRMKLNGDEYSAEAVKLDFRIKCLKETLSSSTGNREAAFIRWTRFFFAFDYMHTLSGTEAIELNNNELPFTIKEPVPDDINTKWLIEYHMGFFDSDALSGYVYGSLKIPVDLDQALR